MHNFKIFLLTTLAVILGCNTDDDGGTDEHESDQFSICNKLLSECFKGNGNYCLLGYKWGGPNIPFETTGYDVV